MTQSINPSSDTPTNRHSLPVTEKLSDLEWTFRTLWRRKGFIFLTSVASVLAGTFYLKQASEMHLVGAKLFVQEATASLDHDARVRNDPRFVATQAEIIRSPVVVERALQSLASGEAAGAATKSKREDGLAHSRVDARTLDSVMRSLHVVPVGSTNIIQISLRSPEPPTAIRQLKAIISSYDEYMNDLKRGSYVDALKILTKQEKSLRQELSAMQAEYQQLRAESSLLGEGREVLTAHLALLRQLGDELFTAKRSRIELESQMLPVRSRQAAPPENAVTQLTQQVGEAVADSIDRDAKPLATAAAGVSAAPAVQDSATSSKGVAAASAVQAAQGPAADLLASADVAPIDERLSQDIAVIRKQKWEAEAELQRIAATFGPRHPSYRGLQDQIALWNERLAEMEQTAPAIAARSLDAARRSEEYLAEVYDDEYQKVKSMDTFMLKEQQAMENIKRVQQIHESTLQKIEDWKLSNALADGQLLTVKILEDPQSDIQQVWPATSRVLVLALLFGVSLAGALVLLFERIRETSGRRHAMA